MESVQANGMTLGTGDVLLPGVLLVTGGGRYLNPVGVTTLMTFFTGVVRDYCVLFNSLITPEGKIKQQHSTGKQALVVATVATYVPVLTGSPTVPRLLHDVT